MGTLTLLPALLLSLCPRPWWVFPIQGLAEPCSTGTALLPPDLSRSLLAIWWTPFWVCPTGIGDAGASSL